MKQYPTPVTQTHLGFPKRQGKVRDVYDLGHALLIVSTDRISAFDWVLPGGIPNKGRVLTTLSQFWFNRLPVEHHLLAMEAPQHPQISAEDRSMLADRSMVVRKAEVVPFECVVRGYLEGSGWSEYQRSGKVCGVSLPAGLKQCDRLPEPIFTPATKAETGHDENVSFEVMANSIGLETASKLRDLSLEVYRQAASYAASRGLIIADTKFEWGWFEGRLILIDEVLTPDSSRFWPADLYIPGQSQASFDKQFVRQWLLTSGWDRNSPPPELPASVVEQTADKYVEAYERLSGVSFM
ncbi:MAG: phosphoribosylaminoimidazolesuccinocarboxamide synthase [Pirellulaceae bacterium]|nr:phosphoribosylaminoimidazolesuccinocarboxamide synthase [Pirellulaceae bacterium]